MLPWGMYNIKIKRKNDELEAERMRQCDDDYDYDDYYYPEVEPKESVKKDWIQKEVVSVPFKCDGSIFNSKTHKRDVATIRQPHDVAASPSQAAEKWSHISRIESLLPMTCTFYNKTDWVQCPECAKLDSVYAVSAKEAYAARLRKEHQEMEKSRKRRQQHANEKYKRRRKAEGVVAKTAIQMAIQEQSSTVSDNAELSEMKRFVELAKKHCKVPELKALCRANHLMLSGTKPELLLRLAHCKRHGGPGKCPSCRHPRLRFEYEDVTDLMALPIRINCSYVYQANKVRCRYVHSIQTLDSESKRMRSVPLVDTSAGTLAMAGLSAGSQTNIDNEMPEDH